MQIRMVDNLLRLKKGTQHDLDGHIDVVLTHVFSQMHSGRRLRHAHDTFDVAHCDWNPCRPHIQFIMVLIIIAFNVSFRYEMTWLIITAVVGSSYPVLVVEVEIRR